MELLLDILGIIAVIVGIVRLFQRDLVWGTVLVILGLLLWLFL